MKKLLAAILSIVALSAGAAHAQSDLDDILSLWLDGNDRDALPALAEMAAHGNLDAQRLLSRIESSDLGPSPFRLSLPPDARRALFRHVTETSTFGHSWIRIAAAEGDVLAQALLLSRDPQPDLQLIAALHEMGEAQAAQHATQVLALYGTEEEQAALLSSPYILPELSPYLDYLSRPAEPRGNGLSALRYISESPQITAEDTGAHGMASLLALGYGFGDMDPANPWRGAVETWLMQSPHTAPIAGLCSAACGPDAAPACAFTLMSVIGGYYEVIRIDSPVEALIPQDAFLESRRAQLMALRRAVLVRQETNLGWIAEPDEIAAHSQCAADLIEEERARY